jgi:hypothetical protein
MPIYLSSIISNKKREKLKATNTLKLLVFSEKDYNAGKGDFLKTATGHKNKICYVLLNSPYIATQKEFAENGIPLENFCFIDVLSSHYEQPKKEEHCLYLSGPNINEIVKGIKLIKERKNPDLILFDNISALLSFYPGYDIQKMTHNLNIDNGVDKIYLLEEKEDDETKRLIQDLSLFADEVVRK